MNHAFKLQKYTFIEVTHFLLLLALQQKLLDMKHLDIQNHGRNIPIFFYNDAHFGLSEQNYRTELLPEMYVYNY